MARGLTEAAPTLCVLVFDRRGSRDAVLLPLGSLLLLAREACPSPAIVRARARRLEAD